MSDYMNEMMNLITIDYGSFFISLFLILFGLASVCTIIEKVSVMIGKPVKWIKNKESDHADITNIKEQLAILEAKQVEDKTLSDEHDKKIQDKLSELADMVIDSRVEDMRWKILDFSTDLSNGKVFNRESFDYVLKTYDDYEKILKSQNKQNGLVEESIHFIKEKYREQLRNGI